MKLPSVLDGLISRIPLTDKIPGSPGEKVLLELDLGRGLAEAGPTNPLEALRALRTPQLRTLVDHLRKAQTDDTVVGLIGVIYGGGLTLAQANELRAAVRSFRTSGKPTVAFSPAFGELGDGSVGYHLATAFEEIWLQPASTLGLVGFQAGATFLRGTLDKLGIQPEFGQRHEYKSAADTFTRTDLTEPHREMLTRLVESITEQVVADIASDRNLEVEAVREAMDHAPLAPEDALERRLVDRVGYRDEAYASVRERIGVAEPTLRYVERHGVSKFSAVMSQLPKPAGKPSIAVIDAIGSIAAGHPRTSPGGGRQIGSESLGAALRAAAKDKNIAGVVLRIDSPGGSAVASDSLRRDILQVRLGGKPVVASMASVAASGGYYIAMPCDRIVASPGTITGSIGVLAGKLVLRGAFDKIGLNQRFIAGSKRAAMFSSQEPFDEEEWAVLDAWLDRIYDDFTAKAALDRNLPVEDLRAVAKGRVWTGADALGHRLVDRLGGLADAIEETCTLLDVTRRDVEVVPFPKPNPFAAFQPPESSEAVTLAATLPLEGPVLWQRLVTGLQEATGLVVPGVLSLPPVHLPGVLPDRY
ncbi:MAG: signal peptide peptidase SppA [Tetrasphaera sp.]|nr:signal peptide peptidase SppA [Tetrasphaera sp.]